MVTVQTPIGKVQYNGVFRFVLAVPSNTKLGTTVIQRSNSGVTLIEALRKRNVGVVINAVPGAENVVVAHKNGHQLMKGDTLMGDTLMADTLKPAVAAQVQRLLTEHAWSLGAEHPDHIEVTPSSLRETLIKVRPPDGQSRWFLVTVKEMM